MQYIWRGEREGCQGGLKRDQQVDAVRLEGGRGRLAKVTPGAGHCPQGGPWEGCRMAVCVRAYAPPHPPQHAGRQPTLWWPPRCSSHCSSPHSGGRPDAAPTAPAHTL
eukprot:233311-Chlamydomonas_euryale.AAC.1